MSVIPQCVWAYKLFTCKIVRMSKYAAFFAALKASQAAGNPCTKEEVVREFTDGFKESLRELSDIELNELVRRLTALNPQPSALDPKADKMRKAIIAIFRSMGRTVDNAKAWAEKQGAFKNKRPFNEYSAQELHVLIRLAEKVKSDHLAAQRKTIRNKTT